MKKKTKRKCINMIKWQKDFGKARALTCGPAQN